MSDTEMAEVRPATLRRAGRIAALWGPTVLYMAAIFALSSMPRPPEPLARILSSDKLSHLVEYALFGLLLSRSLAGSGRRFQTAGVLSLGAFYGVTDELHQHFVPGRTVDLFDWLADVLGVGLGAVVWRLWAGLIARRTEGLD
jgi:VanZ family protein